MATDWLGETIGNCRIEEKIGEGGCGQVFRGVDLMLDRRVAIKVLHAKLAGRIDVAERFRHEAHAMARLSHPNVATLYSFHRENGNDLMIMEYVEGDTFEALLKKNGPMSPATAIPLLLQALAGVGHAHREGILHRDLKATNLMLNEAGVVKVMDFGIAEALRNVGPVRDGESDSTTLSTGDSLPAGSPVGTPEYMSPEQARGEALDPRADVYALGVLLFKLLTGRLPIRGDNPTEVMRAQVERPPRPIRTLAPDLPESVALAVERAMEKSIERRFANVEAFSQSLESALAESEPILLDVVESDDPTPVACDADSPEREVGPTQLVWNQAFAKPWVRRPAVWGSAALLGVAVFGFWLAQTGSVQATRAGEPGASDDVAVSPHRLPPLAALPPVGFEEWPFEPRPGVVRSGPLGPLDFGVIPTAPSLPETIVQPIEEAIGPTPPESIEDANAGAGAHAKKGRARGSAKPQNRTRRVERTPRAPAADPPPSEPGPAPESQGRSCGWVIRR